MKMDLVSILNEMNVPFTTDRASVPFDTLGLCDSDAPGVVCTYVQDPVYLDAIKPKQAALLLNERVRGDERSRGYSCAVVEDPRAVFFLLHNHLIAAHSDAYCRPRFKTVVGAGCSISPLAAMVSMGSVVTKDVADGEHVSGNFAIPHDRYIAHMKRIAARGKAE